MNLWSVTAMGIGAMVGAGIFALLGRSRAGGRRRDLFIVHTRRLRGRSVGIFLRETCGALSRCRWPGNLFQSGIWQKSAVGRRCRLIYLLTIAATIALVAKAFGAYAAQLAFGDTNPLWISGFASAITILAVLLNISDSRTRRQSRDIARGDKARDPRHPYACRNIRHDEPCADRARCPYLRQSSAVSD